MWTEYLEQIFQIIVIPLLPLVFLLLRGFIQNQIQYLKDKNEREYFDYHIDLIESLILDVVGSINQIYVEGLKESGSFTKEKQKEMFMKAKQEVLAQLTTAGKEVLEKTYTDYLAWIEVQIEQAVSLIKE